MKQLGIVFVVALLWVPSLAQAQRAGWLSDAVDLKEGDIVTVVIDEQTEARERVSEVGSSRRGLSTNLSADINGESTFGATSIGTGLNADSRNVGEAGRTGDLFGVVSTRVIEVDENGLATIEGKKMVTIDGRKQEISVTGVVRPEDLSSRNVIQSSRLADASIQYEGVDIQPKKGIFGKILSILWP